MKQLWELRRDHDLVLAEAYRACGNEDPHRVRKFDAKIFWPILDENGHDKASFQECKCRQSVNS